MDAINGWTALMDGINGWQRKIKEKREKRKMTGC
jgi:hypothetical protein